MQKLRYESILRRLRKEGMRTCEFSMVSKGEYAADDADWNYKDIPHLPIVHRLADTAPIVVGEDIICTINLQNILGMWFPMTLVNYEAEKNRQIYYTTMLFFVLVVETCIEETHPLNTTVTTTYNIAYPRWLGFAVPALRWLVKRNYRVLMSEDLPMRDRRGQLRKIGYRFIKKAQTYGFFETINIYEDRILPPETAKLTHSIDYQAAFGTKNECYIGDIGLLGLRLTRNDDQVTVWPRTCPHEGASLDNSPCKEGAVHCPWHGRKINPIGTFQWGKPATLSSTHYIVEVQDATITWQYTKEAPSLGSALKQYANA